MKNVVVEVKGRRGVQTLEERAKEVQAKIDFGIAASQSEADLWSAAEQALFGRLLRPRPVVAVQPTKRLFHRTRMPHHNI